MASEFNNFKINFEDDDNENDIYSSSKKDEYEDISSGKNRFSDDEFIDFDSFSDGENDIYSNKEQDTNHGFFKKINDWWSERKVHQKVGIILLLIAISIVSLFVIWAFFPLELRGKLFCSAFGFLVLNIGVYLCVRWKKRKLQTVIMSFFSLLLSAIMVLTLFFWLPFLNIIYNYDSSFTSDPEVLGAVDPIDKNITNIALFGIDTRDTTSFSGNSDSIMVLSINAREHTVKIISIMRDSLVPIERNGSTIYSKINSAYARGGAELAVHTINSIFGLDITEYATVNFFGMAKIIEGVGGIEAELTDREVKARGNNNHGINDMIDEICRIMKYNPSDYYITQSGKQRLNGIQAVAYSRIRYVPNIWGNNNDYGRTERQRYVMEQLFNKALTMNASSYPGLIKSLIPYTVTSLSPDEILSFAFNIMTKSPTFKQASLPYENCEMRAPSGSFGSVVYYDLDFAAELIHSFIYENVTFEEYVAENGITKNDWYRDLFGSSSGGSGGSGNTSTTPSYSDDTSEDTTDGEDVTDGEDTTSDTESGDVSSDDLTSSDGENVDSSDGSGSSDTTDGTSSDTSSDTGSSSDSSGGSSDTGSGSGGNGGSSEETGTTGDNAA